MMHLRAVFGWCMWRPAWRIPTKAYTVAAKLHVTRRFHSSLQGDVVLQALVGGDVSCGVLLGNGPPDAEGLQHALLNVHQHTALPLLQLPYFPGTWVRRSGDPQMELFFKSLMWDIASLMHQALSIAITISPHDLFHGHLFRNTTACPDATLHGVLFHTQEYPQYHDPHFPYDLGKFQRNSTLQYNPHHFRFRNVLWLHQVNQVFALDAHHPLISALIPEYWRAWHTVDEALLGQPIADLYYLPHHHHPSSVVTSPAQFDVGWVLMMSEDEDKDNNDEKKGDDNNNVMGAVTANDHHDAHHHDGLDDGGIGGGDCCDGGC